MLTIRLPRPVCHAPQNQFVVHLLDERMWRIGRQWFVFARDVMFVWLARLCVSLFRFHRNHLRRRRGGHRDNFGRFYPPSKRTQTKKPSGVLFDKLRRPMKVSHLSYLVFR